MNWMKRRSVRNKSDAGRQRGASAVRTGMHMLAASIAGIAVAGGAHAEIIATPNGDAGAYGGASSTAPFNGPFRYQQDYAASQFGGSEFEITEIAFRPANTQTAAFSAVVPNMTVMLSLTSKGTTGGASGLSSTFANNPLGAQTTVFSGSMTFNSNPAGVPHGFDVVISLTTPFLYNPSEGNLLMEIDNQSAWDVSPGSQVGFLDFAIDSSMARVYARGSAASPTATVADANDPDRGLVTEFVGEAVSVPEPSSMALLMAGFAAVAWRRRSCAGNYGDFCRQ
jgi:hypothetical protein